MTSQKWVYYGLPYGIGALRGVESEFLLALNYLGQTTSHIKAAVWLKNKKNRLEVSPSCKENTENSELDRSGESLEKRKRSPDGGRGNAKSLEDVLFQSQFPKHWLLFITRNCLYCLCVTAWFLKRWNKLWKPQQGSLLNIKSMHYICWNPGEPEAAVPNSSPQQELCGAFGFQVWPGSCHPLKTFWRLFSQSAGTGSSSLPPPATFLPQLGVWGALSIEPPWFLHGLMKEPPKVVF